MPPLSAWERLLAALKAAMQQAQNNKPKPPVTPPVTPPRPPTPPPTPPPVPPVVITPPIIHSGPGTGGGGGGTATQLGITTQPSSSATNASTFAVQPVIQLRDASSNPVSQAGVNVTVSISSGGGTLSGTTTIATNAFGVATFTNLAITGTIGARSLLFSSGSLTTVTSTSVTISAGSATQLTITTQPSSSATSAATLAPQPVIQIRDVSGNAVSATTPNIVCSVGSGTSALTGTTTKTPVAGVATYTDLILTGADTNTLAFAGSGLTGVTSNSIVVSTSASGEPIYTPGTSNLIASDNFDEYTTVATMGSGSLFAFAALPGPYGDGGSLTPAAQLITGRSGSGKAIRLAYTGVAQYSPNWITVRTPTTGKTAIHCFQYWARTSSASTMTQLAVKWFEIWHHTNASNRIQFATHDHIPWNGAGYDPNQTYWQVYDLAETASQATQPFGPYLPTLMDSTWRRFTYMFRHNTSSGSRDAIARMWVGGTKIIDVSASAVGIIPSGGQKVWCNNDDIDAIQYNDSVEYLRFGSTQTTDTPAWNYDIDDFIWWTI